MFLRILAFIQLVISVHAMSAEVNYTAHYADAIKNISDQLSKLELHTTEVSLSEKTRVVDGSTIGVVIIKLKSGHRFVMQTPLDIKGIPFDTPTFQNTVLQKTLYRFDTSILMPDGLLVDAESAMKLVYEELHTLRENVRAALVPGQETKFKRGALVATLSPFHDGYIRSLLQHLGTVTYKPGASVPEFNFKTFEFKTTVEGYRELRAQILSSQGQMFVPANPGADHNLKIHLIEELLQYTKLHMALLSGGASEDAAGKEILKYLDPIMNDLKALHKVYLQSEGKRTPTNRWIFRDMLAKVFSRLTFFEKQGMRLAYTLSPVEFGSKLFAIQNEINGVNREIGLEAAAKDALAAKNTELTKFVMLEHAKLMSQIEALERIKDPRVLAEKENLIRDQLVTIEHQYMELLRTGATINRFTVRK